MSDTTIKRPGASYRRPGVQIIKSAKATIVREGREPKGKGIVKLPVKVRPFRALLRKASLTERVQIEREGVPYQIVQGLINDMNVSSAEFQCYVRLPKATFTKRMKDKAQFAGTTGQAVVGIMDLINQVEDILSAQHDNPEARGFDVEQWVGHWIQRPQPALGGLAPAALMDTPAGRASVMRLLGSLQSGAYQ